MCDCGSRGEAGHTRTVTAASTRRLLLQKRHGLESCALADGVGNDVVAVALLCSLHLFLPPLPPVLVRCLEDEEDECWLLFGV